MQTGEMQVVMMRHGNEWVWPLDPMQQLPENGLVWSVCPWCFGALPAFKRLTPHDWLRLWREIYHAPKEWPPKGWHPQADGEGEE
jgi:hypothetical protein